MHNAVRGQDRQAGRFDANERGHHEFRARVFLSAGAAKVTVSKRGFVAMMPVGNHQPLVPHSRGHELNRFSLRFAPDGMVRAVLIVHALPRGRGGAGRERALDFTRRVAVEHEKLAEVRARVLQQFQPVGLRAAQRFFMAMHQVRGIILKMKKRDKAAPLFALRRLARSGIFLVIGKDRRRRVRCQRSGANPFFEIIRRTRVYVRTRFVARLLRPANDVREIVRARLEVPRLHRGRDLVVRLRDQAPQVARDRRVVVQRSKGKDFRHRGCICPGTKGTFEITTGRRCRRGAHDAVSR